MRYLLIAALIIIQPLAARSQEDDSTSYPKAEKFGVTIKHYGESYLVNFTDVFGVSGVALYDSTGQEAKRWTNWPDVLEVKHPDQPGRYYLQLTFFHGVETRDVLEFE